MNVSRRSLLASSLAAPLLNALPLAGFPLGVTTDEIDDDVAKAAGLLREFNLGYAEIRHIWGKYNTSHTMDRIHEAKAILDAHKLRVSILGTGFFKIPLPDETPAGRAILDNQWSLLDAAMERASAFGTRKIRIFAFTYKDGESPDSGRYPRIYELVAEAARRARVRGFRLCVENVGQSYVWTGEQAAELLKHVKADNLGLTWDPNNAGAAGEKSFPDGYRKLDPQRILHVHLRDYRKNAQGKYEWCAVGEGEMDNLGQIRALQKAGYKGTYTLETHWKSPKGREHATRTSLAALLRIVEQA